jgi:hypothetical protein
LAILALYALLVFSDVAPLVGVRVLLVLLAQIFTGGEIYRYFKKSESLSLVEYAAFGFAFGSLTWLISDQVFITISFPKVGWLVPFIAALVRRYLTRKSVARHIEVNWQSLQWIFVATFLGLSGEWVWTLPFALFVTVVLWLRNKLFSQVAPRLKNLASRLLIAGSAMMTLASRPKVWWISQGDTHFYEGLTKSVAKWGWHESIFSAGFSLQYHWFPYAWSGLVTRISESPDWVVITRVGFLIPALCLVSFVWIVSSRLSSSPLAPIFGVLIFSASSVFGEWFVIIPLAMMGSFSQLFATVWLFPVLLWAIDFRQKSISKSWLYLCLLFVGLVGGKVSHAAIAAAFFLSFQAFNIWQNRRFSLHDFFATSVVLITMFVTSRILFGSGGSLSPRPAAWAPYLQGDLYAFYGRSLWVAAAVLVIGMGYLSFCTVIIGATFIREHSVIFFSLITSLIAGIVFSNLSSGPTSPNGLFFLHASVMLVVSVSGVVAASIWNKGKELVKVEAAACVLIAVVSLLAIYLIPDRDSGANSAIWLRTIRSLVVLLPAVIIPLLFAVRKSSDRVLRIGKGVLLATITMSVTSFIATNGSSYNRDMSGFERNSDLYLPSEDLIELRDWLRENSSDRDIYSSNYVCEGEDCSAPQLSQRALLSTIIERRALIESPWIASAFTEPKSRNGAGDFAERLEYSAAFAQNPSRQMLDFFLTSEVRWYVVDLSRTNNGQWQGNPAVVFANDSFVLIDLNSFEI